MSTTREQVRFLHAAGHGTKAIADTLKLSTATISYHKKALGVAECQRYDIDWSLVRQRISEGVSRALIMAEFKIGSERYTKAIREGLVQSRVSTLPIETHLVENSSYGRVHLKKRLLRDGLLKEKCAGCGIGKLWNGQPLVLALDHINGVNNDNRLENLRLLCPNCHSQTPTFAGRNGRKSRP